MKDMTIETVMRDAKCTVWPTRWKEFFDEVMATFDREGCPLTDPAYYRDLHQKYGVLTEDLAVYCTAAAMIGEDEALSRFLALLSRAMTERETILADLSELKLPDDGEGSLKYAMLPALVMCQSVPTAHAIMKARGVPEDILAASLRVAEGGVKEYRARHGGDYGYHAFDWYQLAYDAKLYAVGRLQLELPFLMPKGYRVYQNAQGETVTLADGTRFHRDGMALGALHYEDEEGAFVATITENEQTVTGHPFDTRGFLKTERRTLDKREWRLALESGDPVVSLHIPAGGGFSDEAITKTIADARVFLANCFPEYHYRAFHCGSWLVDPALRELLGEDANISKFCRRFTPLCIPSRGQAVFGFVFLKPDENFVIAELPEKTSLERALKKRYLNGGAIYEMHGFFF